MKAITIITTLFIMGCASTKHLNDTEGISKLKAGIDTIYTSQIKKTSMIIVCPESLTGDFGNLGAEIKTIKEGKYFIVKSLKPNKSIATQDNRRYSWGILN